MNPPHSKRKKIKAEILSGGEPLEHTKSSILVDDDFLCSSCFKIPSSKKVLQCSNGHIMCEFCHASLHDLPQDKRKCPKCHVYISRVPTRCLIAEKVLLTKSVKCPYGCKHEIGALDVLDHRKTCPHYEVPCKFAPFGCANRHKRKSIHIHERQCPMRRLRVEDLLERTRKKMNESQVYVDVVSLMMQEHVTMARLCLDWHNAGNNESKSSWYWASWVCLFKFHGHRLQLKLVVGSQFPPPADLVVPQEPQQIENVPRRVGRPRNKPVNKENMHPPQVTFYLELLARDDDVTRTFDVSVILCDSSSGLGIMPLTFKQTYLHGCLNAPPTIVPHEMVVTEPAKVAGILSTKFQDSFWLRMFIRDVNHEPGEFEMEEDDGDDGEDE